MLQALVKRVAQANPIVGGMSSSPSPRRLTPLHHKGYMDLILGSFFPLYCASPAWRRTVLEGFGEVEPGWLMGTNNRCGGVLACLELLATVWVRVVDQVVLDVSAWLSI